MKTVLFFILPQYADFEVAYISTAITMLGKGQFNIKTVALSKDSIKSIGGFTTIPDYDIDSVPYDFDALVLIGGMTWRTENTEKIKELALRCKKENKILAGICDAAGFLARIGILNDVYHTGNDLNDIKKWSGTAYTGESKYVFMQAVSDRNIITANGTAAMEFAKEILFTLNVATEKEITDWYNFHKLGAYVADMPKM